VAALDAVDTLITDARAPAADLARLREQGLEVIVVED
jgi:hypothetical protein